MPIDFSSECLLTFKEASERLPGKPNLSTLHRWRQRGVNGVQLETCRIGGKRYTSVEALERFAERTTAAASAATERNNPTKRRERQMDRAVADVENLLGTVNRKSRDTA